MRELAAWAITEKNRIDQLGAWIYLVQIDFPKDGGSDIVRLSSDNDSTTVWNNLTWTGIPMVVGEISENLDEIPQITIEISNILYVMATYILEFSYYTKTTGSYSVPVYVHVVNTNHMDDPTAVTTHVFELINSSMDNKWIRLTVGAPNPFRKRFPTARILKNQCQVKRFKGIDCGYNGSVETCDRTLTTCRTLLNAARFGGFPGVGDNVYKG